MSASAQMHDFEYLQASNINVSNFVSVKLSGNRNYPLWEAQMRCLLKSNNMCAIVDTKYIESADAVTNTMTQYDNIVKGWIFGSLTEDVLGKVFELNTANQVWEKLNSFYTPAKANPEEEKPYIISERNKTEEDELREATLKGDWLQAESILKIDEGLATKAIDSDGSTLLHIAVGAGHNDFVREMLSYLNEDQVLQPRTSDGSTSLHVAAIVGNTHAAKLLVRKNKQLLEIKDMQGEDPLHKAYKNMQFDTIEYLLEAVNDYSETSSQTSQPSSVDGSDHNIGVDLIVNAIFAKRYSFAAMLVKKFPELASKDHEVLMAIAKNFPSELHFREKLICPSLSKTATRRVDAALTFVYHLKRVYDELCRIFKEDKNIRHFQNVATFSVHSVFSFIWFLMLMVYFPVLPLYSLCWQGAKILVEPIKQIENKKKEWDEAKELLELVCKKIDSKYEGKHHSCYTRPFFEAACHNAYKVVDEILSRSVDIIHQKDENKYDIIELAIMHRSEKIYNLIYDIGERKNLYRTSEYPFGNNILHLAGKLAPSSVLNKITGAALQLQRELQWREEVKNLVLPKDINKENNFKETPDMIFTREHKNLVQEGEQWMKTTAESCSIAAALITTIVFAAVITVPGGNNQEKGTPLFEKESAFIVFAISDAIALFSSLTALMVFLSILTTRFAEKDFLFSLPRRLFIGLFSLLLSTAAMMVAFSATLYLVFSDEKLWILAPICGLAIIPIAFFVGLQFPLMVDLFRSTYMRRIFGKQRKRILKGFNACFGTNINNTIVPENQRNEEGQV